MSMTRRKSFDYSALRRRAYRIALPDWTRAARRRPARGGTALLKRRIVIFARVDAGRAG